MALGVAIIIVAKQGVYTSKSIIMNEVVQRSVKLSISSPQNSLWI